MAKLTISQFSDKTKKELRDTLEERRQNKAFRIGESGSIDESVPRTVRWVRALESSTATMCRVQVEFGDLAFDDTASGVTTETFEAYAPQVTRFALDRDGVVADGDIVRATMHHGRWYIDTPSGISCHTVRFIVVSNDPATRTALGMVLARPVGCTDVPESSLGGTVIEICDPLGCFFNEVNLIGRHGWARYMMPVVENVCQPDPYYLLPEWEVFSLCCALPTCDVQQ